MLRSYLSNRTYKFKINETLSDAQPLAFMVPQGSIPGPILYPLDVKDIVTIAESYSIKVPIYADDVQSYTACDNICGNKRQQSKTPFLQKLHFLPIKFTVDFKVCLLVHICKNNPAPEYLKCMLLSQNTDFDKRTRQDYDRTGLRMPPVTKLR